jgi:hypothetical protein
LGGDTRVRAHSHDILMRRENTEGEYSGLEHEVVPDVVESLKVITEVRLSWHLCLRLQAPPLVGSVELPCNARSCTWVAAGPAACGGGAASQRQEPALGRL